MKTPNGSFDDIIHDIRLYKRSYMALWHENESLKNKLKKMRYKKITKWWSKQELLLRMVIIKAITNNNKRKPEWLYYIYNVFKGKKITDQLYLENKTNIEEYFTIKW